MDLKAYPKLDPKLKETYDRIMGMKAGVKSHDPSSGEHVAQVTIDDTPATQPPHSPATQHAAGHLSHIAYNAATGTIKPEEKKHEIRSTDHKEERKPQSMIVPIILGVSGVIFFIFYAIFWMRFFGM